MTNSLILPHELNPAAETISHWSTTLGLLADLDLLRRTARLAETEREHCAWLVAHLAEVDRRELALQAGFPSLFKYARHHLRLSDAKALERVAAARLSRHFPETPQKIMSGELSLDSATDLWRAFQEEERRTRPSLLHAEAKAREQAIAPPLPLPLGTTSGSEAPPSGAGTLKNHPAPKAPTLDEMRRLYEQALGKSRNETQATIESWKHERSGVSVPPKARMTSITLSLSDEDELAWNRLRDLLSHRLGSRSPEAALRWLVDQGLEKLDPVRVQAR
jgi:hypothetical protein